MVTSSYENSIPQKAENNLDGVKFRRVPVAAAFDATRDRIAQCNLDEGHVLQFRNGKVVCIECEAEWVDEGF